MKQKAQLPLKIRILRWIARVWSLALFIFALVFYFSPDPNASGEPLPLNQAIQLGLLGVSILGLLLAWKWERLGVLITISTMVLRDILFVITEGRWFINFLLFWVVILPPAIMYLLAWKMEKKLQNQ